MGFLCVLKMYHVRLYIVEKIGFEMATRRYEIHSKPQPLLQKTCIFYVSKTLTAYAGVCLRTHALAHICMLWPTYVGCCPRMWVKDHFGHFISKNIFVLI